MVIIQITYAPYNVIMYAVARSHKWKKALKKNQLRGMIITCRLITTVDSFENKDVLNLIIEMMDGFLEMSLRCQKAARKAITRVLVHHPQIETWIVKQQVSFSFHMLQVVLEVRLFNM